ncbi:MAG: CBS domain-containing protein [Myxococcota bacterium]
MNLPHVRDVMAKNPVTVDEQTHLSDVLDLMEQRHFKHLPVVQDGKLVGLITDRQLRDALPSVLTLSDPAARRRSLAVTRVGQVCVRDPRVVESSATVLHAIRIMREIRAGSLPVVDDGKLVGILTSGDLITLLETMLKESH